MPKADWHNERCRHARRTCSSFTLMHLFCAMAPFCASWTLARSLHAVTVPAFAFTHEPVLQIECTYLQRRDVPASGSCRYVYRLPGDWTARRFWDKYQPLTVNLWSGLRRTHLGGTWIWYYYLCYWVCTTLSTSCIPHQSLSSELVPAVEDNLTRGLWVSSMI